MNIRHDNLRDVLRYLRRARACLTIGDLPGALRLANLASEHLAFTRGLFRSTSATCRLRRAVLDLQDEIERAVRPRPAPLPYDVVRQIAEGLMVLRKRDGVELDDDQVWERARNIAAGLIGTYDIRELPDGSAQTHSAESAVTERLSDA